MRRLCAFFVFISCCFAAEDEAARLKEMAKGLREADAEALEPLKELHSEKAAEFVLSAISSNRVGGGLKARLAEIVANWPKVASGRKTLLEWFSKHPACDDDELLFFAQLRLVEARSQFWTLIDAAKGEPAKLKDPQRIAMAVMALGEFQDNPESVVTRIGSLLKAEFPHVIRACAADALGGMRHEKAVDALMPFIDDGAIGSRAVRSLYRLTGLHFDADAPKQWADWRAKVEKIEFKMLSAADFTEFLKTQALIKPVDETQIDMEAFYGIKLEGNGLLFILDVSGSMDVDGRISKLRGQISNILNVLSSRPTRLRYGILTFSDGVESCFSRGGVSENNDKARETAQRFVDRLTADGGTSMVAAFTHAAQKVLPDSNLDTIYFLTDGDPSDGTPEMVLDAVRRVFQRHQCRVHCIAIGEDEPAQFGEKSLLEQIAALTSGSFTRVK